MPEVAAWLAELSSANTGRAESAASQPPSDKEKSLAALAELINEKDPDTRWWAVRALAEFESNKAGEWLTDALNDNDESVQRCAALSLRKRPHPDSTKNLIHHLSSADKLLARLSGDALIALGESATSALLEVLNASDESAKVEAARALATIGDTGSISDLFKLLSSDSAILEHWANEGLEKMGIGMRFFDPNI